jgi:ribosome-associated protein
MDIEKQVAAVIAALEDIKGHDILVLDVSRLTSLFERIVLASADSTRQVKALAHHVGDRARELGMDVIGIEGEQAGEWVLVDLGDIVVHVMQPAVRSHYNLEELWGDEKRIKAARSRAPS